jgi:glutathione S-transferase
MRLHWSPRSPFVRKVMIAAHELGLADRIATVRTRVSMTEPHAGILADNPIGKIPTLVLEDGTALYDSGVICEYLDALAGGTLVPRDGPARWTALRRHALGTGFLDMLILWRYERARVEPHPGVLAGFEGKAAATLAALEAEAPALGRDAFSIGHLALGCALGYLDFRFAELGWREGRPALAAWAEGFAARPSVRAVPVMDD